MKKYLITLLIIPTLIFADAVIFSGSDVKTLKPNIDLFGVAKILTTSTIPTAGLTAPKGSIAMYTTTGDLYLKTGALSTDWTKNQTGPVNLTTDVTGTLPVANGGTGSATQNFVDLTTAQTVAGAKTFTGTPTAFTPTASTTAATTRFLFTGAADTTLTASTEAPNVYFNMGQTRQHSTGTLSTQRDFRISPSTHSFVGASTLTNSSSFSVDGPTLGGTNATLTNSSAIYVPTSLVTNVTNSYGVNVAATTGATNNYAGVFTGGNLGVGTATPTSLLHALENNSATGNSNGITIEQSGTGDAVHHFMLTGVQRYTMGIDNSDSDKFKIGTSADLGSNNLFTMTTSGKVGIGTTAPSTTLDVNGLITSAGAIAVYYQSPSIFSSGFNVYKRGTTGDATASLASGTELGYNSFYGWDGSAYGRGAFVLTTTTEAWSGTGHGSYYSIWTTPTGSTTNAERMRIDQNGNVGVGGTPNANAILDVTSTTRAFMPPRMTTAQKNSVASPTAGMVVYDTDMKGISFYNGTAWTTANNKNVATKTANYTALQSDDVILGDATSGAITITLPTAVGFSGKVFNVKKTDSSVNSVTIATTSSQTIDGALTAPLISQYQSLTLVSNGTNWSVL